ncbi:Acetolactate synthase large subunit [Geoglobus acetivorans]|uniref:Acetolactate synthase large subunit n=2 Tax=Geoglobus acetivorans TaxID=565033 RepID=A0A0A7GET5_GEOAI|nr:Acetolactate synthase large subunit [Geoglobus acetivorans]
MKTVAEFLAEALIAAGVERAYGIVGTSVLDFYDALSSHSGKLEVITVRHEQTAVSAADAEFRSSGKLSCAIVHAGPGFLNSAISLGIAMKDRVPLLLISGGVKRRLRGTDAWLEVEQKSVADGLVKVYEVVDDENDLPEVFSKVYESMLTWPYGPGVIEIPEDLWDAELSSVEHVEPPQFQVPKEAPETHDLIEKMRNAKQPAILACGELVRRPDYNPESLKVLSERLSAYVITSGNGRGAIPEDDAMCAGRVGFGGGSLTADRILEDCDFLLVLGNELDDVTTYGYTLLPRGDVVVVSEDPSADVRPLYYTRIRADPAHVLNELARKALNAETADREEWVKRVRSYTEMWNSTLSSFSSKETKLVNPARFFDVLNEKLGRERIVVGGQGTHVIFANNNLKVFSPGTYLAATNLGAMSYALPAGIGAKKANPERDVVVVAGDGEIMMTIQELETVKRENLNLKIVIVNDNSYRVLYIKQLLQKQGRVFQTILENPDFVMLSESFGIPAMKVDSNDQIEEGVEFIIRDGPRLVELVIDRDEIPPLNLNATLKMGSV